MMTTTIRVSTQTHMKLHELAQTAGVSMQQIVEKAIDLYRRQQFLETVNAAYATLRTDEETWNDYEAELSEWDVTLTDGLEDL